MIIQLTPLNIVIPAAGAGRRFKEAGYSLPKPQLPIGDKAMLEAVKENITPQPGFWVPQWHVIEKTPGLTQGAACTILTVADEIDNEDHLLIVNADQMVDVNISEFLTVCSDYDGGIMTFRDTDPKWSFVRVKHDYPGDVALVEEVAEKIPISDIATVGIYYFAHGCDFVEAAKEMIRKDIRYKGEFYVAPVFNELILQEKRIISYEIPKEKFHGLGTPEDYEAYLKWLSDRPAST